MVDIALNAIALPEHVTEYAAIVHAWSMRRKIHHEAHATMLQALNPDLNPVGYAASVVTRFQAIRDGGTTEDITALMLSELLDQADDEPDWLIPGLLERRDRLMLTGQEGLGKSYLLRQIAVLASFGITPWDHIPRMEPIRALIYDCENSWSQVRRKVRPLVDFARSTGADGDRVMVQCTSRIDICRDRDLAGIHRAMDAFQPDLVVIGPLYRLTPEPSTTTTKPPPSSPHSTPCAIEAAPYSSKPTPDTPSVKPDNAKCARAAPLPCSGGQSSASA